MPLLYGIARGDCLYLFCFCASLPHMSIIIRNVTAAPATAAAATAAITVMTVRFVPEFSASGSAVSSVLSLSGASVSVMLFAVSCVVFAFPAEASAEALSVEPEKRVYVSSAARADDEKNTVPTVHGAVAE